MMTSQVVDKLAAPRAGLTHMMLRCGVLLALPCLAWRCCCQVFKDNMSVKGEPKITACKPGENWTAVSFRPDLAKFGMQELEADAVALMRKRVYDLAGVLGKTCKVRGLGGPRVGGREGRAA